jgi:hypothetical protein
LQAEVVAVVRLAQAQVTTVVAVVVPTENQDTVLIKAAKAAVQAKVVLVVAATDKAKQADSYKADLHHRTAVAVVAATMVVVVADILNQTPWAEAEADLVTLAEQAQLH